MAPWKRVVARATALTGGLAVAFVAAEVLVRVLVPQGDEFKRFDPQLYISYAPGARGTFVSPSQPDIRTPITINSDGYRGPEFDREARLRLLFLGDSFTAGMEVHDGETFVERTKILLNATNPSVATFNMGIYGSGTGLQLVHYAKRGLALQPQVAVLQFSVGNDFVDNSSSLNWKRYVPYWTLGAAGELVMLEPESRVPAIMSIGRRSQAAVLAFRAYRALLRGRREGACWTNGLYLEDPSADWEDAYRVTLALVRAFVDRSHSSGIEPVIVVVPALCQLQNDRFVAEGSDLLRPQDQLAQALQGDAELIDLFPLFQHEGERRGSADWYRFERDGHFNAEGHAFVAQLLAERIGKWLARQRSTDSSAAVTDQRAATATQF